jgi:DNA-binding CsgD family transcriptional regulator
MNLQAECSECFPKEARVIPLSQESIAQADRGHPFPLSTEPPAGHIRAAAPGTGAATTIELQPPQPLPMEAVLTSVVQLIADGLTNREVALRLHLTLNTVKVHTRNIYGKLDVHSRTQAVAAAERLGLLGRVQ